MADTDFIKGRDDIKEELKDRLESQEFYELMQLYRHAPTEQVVLVTTRFEDIKKFIRG